MEALKYKRIEILEKLKTNRDKHELAYKDAVEGFQEAVVKELTESLKKAKAGTEYRLNLKQSKPTEHLKEYDRAIQMFTMCSQEEIQIEENEFTRYVLDIWNWSNDFVASTRAYGKGSY